MSPAEILERAADVIDERGHCKGRLSSLDNRVCIVGAVSVVLHGDAQAGEPVGHVMRYLWPVVGKDAVGWNDAPERTAAEVTSTMRAVATTLRAQANCSKVREPVAA